MSQYGKKEFEEAVNQCLDLIRQRKAGRQTRLMMLEYIQLLAERAGIHRNGYEPILQKVEQELDKLEEETS